MDIFLMEGPRLDQKGQPIEFWEGPGGITMFYTFIFYPPKLPVSVRLIPPPEVPLPSRIKGMPVPLIANTVFTSLALGRNTDPEPLSGFQYLRKAS